MSALFSSIDIESSFDQLRGSLTLLVARVPPAATLQPSFRVFREIPAAACSPLARRAGVCASAERFHRGGNELRDCYLKCGLMSQMGQSEKSGYATGKSALPPKTDLTLAFSRAGGPPMRLREEPISRASGKRTSGQMG